MALPHSIDCGLLAACWQRIPLLTPLHHIGLGESNAMKANLLVIGVKPRAGSVKAIDRRIRP